jgi:ABC-type branched-subunit amino acid transport system substrate-binding protein
MGNANYLGAEKIIIAKSNLPNNFLDLKTKVAGEILQKFSTYNQKLAIIGDFSSYESKSLNDFIRESNKVGRVLFISDKDEAIKRWSN